MRLFFTSSFGNDILINITEELLNFYLDKAIQAIDSDDTTFNEWFSRAALLSDILQDLLT